jgi:hypothetical protein
LGLKAPDVIAQAGASNASAGLGTRHHKSHGLKGRNESCRTQFSIAYNINGQIFSVMKQSVRCDKERNRGHRQVSVEERLIIRRKPSLLSKMRVVQRDP